MAELMKEKKVEYLELIYDLIFVYIIGRNNSLLQHIENGFVPGGVFFAYVLGTLAVIQIWNYSTFYINVYGRNGTRDHVFLFINMFLLYFMADSTSVYWQSSVYKYSAAWLLILVNLGVQHIIELRDHRDSDLERRQLRHKAFILFGEAALIGVHMLIYALTGYTAAYLPIAFGVVAMLLSSGRNALAPVDFAHLSERAMLYVVFTFGEMIISITPYFEDNISAVSLYFSTMAFLIVAGLFLSYEVLYNKIVDRELITNGTGYMLLHVFLIFALNNISVALEFMREEEVALLPKIMFITGSFMLYFICLFMMGIYAKKRCAFNAKFYLFIGLVGISFFVFMLIFRTNMYLNIAVSVIYVMAIFWILYRRGKVHVEG